MNAKKLLKIRLNHNAEELSRALGMTERRYSEIVEDAVRTFFREEKYTKTVERVCEKYCGNDFILAMIVIGDMIEESEEELERMGYID
ncbi:MAG: hypothetical protein QXI20_12375 [Candidatus Jordarchaeales archaeon]